MKFPLVHRYARRLVVWLSTPSDEECSWEARERQLRQSKRKHLTARLSRVLCYPPMPSEYLGRSADDLWWLRGEIKRLADTGLYAQANVAAHAKQCASAIDAFAGKAA